MLSERIFTQQNQQWFAELSGDQNPLHVDDVYARRTQLGQNIVHGIHAVIWALDAFWEENPSFSIRQINIKFKNPIFLNEKIFCDFNEKKQTICVRTKDVEFINIRLEKCDEKIIAKDRLTSSVEKFEIPIKHEISSLRRFQKFEVNNFVDIGRLQNAYGNCKRILGIETLRGIINLSSIVGMVLPGLNSIFSGCKIYLSEQSKEKFLEVTKCDDRFNLCEFKVYEAAFSADVSTIFRSPATTSGCDDLTKTHKDDALKLHDYRVLILGGSRGIGEKLTATAAMHGATVLFTYNKGLLEAEQLEFELKAKGLKVNSSHFDAYKPDWKVLQNFKPSIVFYMLTPPIFVKRSKAFEAELYDRFYFFYCDLMSEMCLKLNSEAMQLVYYPSSVAVDIDRNINFEYALTKHLGELLVEVISKKLGFRHLVERLPRLKTDQTATHLKIKSRDSYEFALRMLQNSIKEIESDEVTSDISH